MKTYSFGFQLNMLTDIGGTRGKSDGTKVIEAVVHTLIDPAFLPAISWSGRGRAKEEKIALGKYSNLTKLIAEVMNKADRSFDQLKTLNSLKYKVIKYAPAKFASKQKGNPKDKDVTITETVVR